MFRVPHIGFTLFNIGNGVHLLGKVKIGEILWCTVNFKWIFYNCDFDLDVEDVRGVGA